MLKTKHDIWIAISYDGKLTGSLEHRRYNHTLAENLKDLKSKGILSPIGEYAYAYDIEAGKSKEPNFDGLLAYIAVMDDDTFDSNFHYLKVEYNDVPLIDELTSGLSTCLLDTSRIPRKTFSDFGTDYRSFQHVFILGPVSPRVVDYLKTVSGNIIFHFQGEPPCKDDPTKSTTAYDDAMTVYDGLFPVPFNFWTGENEAFLVRSFMNLKFTVKCNADIVLSEVDMLELTPQPKKSTVRYPKIFIDINDWIIKNEYLFRPEQEVSIGLMNLNIMCVAEDLIDKDNLTACAILIKHSSSSIAPHLLLIGRRVYDAGDTGPDFREYTFKTGPRPELLPRQLNQGIQQSNWPWMAPCVPIEGKFSEVQFPGIKEGAMVVNQSLNILQML
jgi:hypothetical protein